MELIWTIGIIGVVAVTFLSYWRERSLLWREKTPHRVPLIFLEPRMGIRPTILGHKAPEAYRLACLFFGTGLIDRTETLDQGFPYAVIDTIPDLVTSTPDMASLCDARANELVQLARSSGIPIRLFWSGGIDSTAACIALLKAVKREPERLQIVYSKESVTEYDYFFRRFVKPHRYKKKINEVSDALHKNYILSSGEHGDQLFGSIKALTIPFQLLNKDWQTTFPEVLNAQFASPGRTDAVLAYLEPQFQRCPIPLNTLFDLLWWMNFSLKWQAVHLRMLSPLTPENFRLLRPNLHHFFRTTAFQQWTLANPKQRIKNNWASYKWPLKEYIRDFTQDSDYYEEKEKEPSLKEILSRGKRRFASAIDEQQNCFHERREASLREQGSSDAGFFIEFSMERETPLWDGMTDGE